MIINKLSLEKWVTPLLFVNSNMMNHYFIVILCFVNLIQMCKTYVNKLDCWHFQNVKTLIQKNSIS